MRFSFAERLLAWFDTAGRHDLPWQHPRSPYRVWLAEVMLQQTQVRTVIAYYQRFTQALPDLPALAQAPLDQVLALWRSEERRVGKACVSTGRSRWSPYN